MEQSRETQVIVTCLLLFTIIYIAINTNLFGEAFSVLRPFINGFILAYLIGIVASKIDKLFSFKGSKGISIALVYILLLLFISLSLVYLIPLILENTYRLLNSFPHYLSIGEFFTFNFNELLERFDIGELINRFSSQVRGATVYARAATNVIFNGMLSIVISIYILISQKSILSFGRRFIFLLAPRKGDYIISKLKKTHEVFQSYLLTQVVAALILGIATAVVLTLIHVNYALLIAILISVLNLIPIFGSIIGVFISIIILFLSNHPMLAGAALVFLLLLQQVDATIIGPKLMGNAMELNPIVILFVLAIGTHMLGFLGILFAIPITVILKEIVGERLKNNKSYK